MTSVATTTTTARKAGVPGTSRRPAANASLLTTPVRYQSAIRRQSTVTNILRNASGLRGSANGRGTAHLHALPLNIAMTRDIWEAYHGILSLHIARDAFLGMVLTKPFSVWMGDASDEEDNRLELTAEFTSILREYWMLFLRDVYDWEKMYGIVPWRFRRLRSGHKVPVVPPAFAGEIRILFNQRRMEFDYFWFWTPSGNHAMGAGAAEINYGQEPDRKMKFIVHRAPTIHGHYTTAMVTVVPEHRMVRVLLTAHERAAERAANVPVVLESHPPSSAADAVNSVVDALWGQQVTGEQLTAVNTADINRNQLNRLQLAMTMHSANQQNAARTGRGSSHTGRGPGSSYDVDASAPDADTAKRWMENKVELQPFQRVVTNIPQPKIQQDLDKFLARLDRSVANVVDFPLALAQTSAVSERSSGNIQGALRYTQDRIKDIQTRFEGYIAEIWSQAYGAVNESECRKTLREMTLAAKRRLTPDEVARVEKRYCSINIKLTTTPLVGYDELRKYWADGVLSHEIFQKAALDIIGMPEGFAVEKGEAQIKRVNKLFEKTPPPPKNNASSTTGTPAAAATLTETAGASKKRARSTADNSNTSSSSSSSSSGTTKRTTKNSAAAAESAAKRQRK